MDRLTISLLLQVVSINLYFSAISHLIPRLGGQYLNPLPTWAGEATFAWELAAACLALICGLLIKPRKGGNNISGRRGQGRHDRAG